MSCRISCYSVQGCLDAVLVVLAIGMLVVVLMCFRRSCLAFYFLRHNGYSGKIRHLLDMSPRLPLCNTCNTGAL